MNQVNLKGKSTVELKALAYDVASLIQQYNQTLQVINQEIAIRAQQQAEQEAQKKEVPKVVDLKKEETPQSEVPAY